MSKYFQAINDTQDVISLNYKELWHLIYSDNFPYYDRQLLKLNKDNGEVFIAFKLADGNTLISTQIHLKVKRSKISPIYVKHLLRKTWEYS